MRRRWVSGTTILALAIVGVLAYLVVMARDVEPALAPAPPPPVGRPTPPSVAMEPAGGNAVATGAAEAAPATTPATPNAAFVPVTATDRAVATRRRPMSTTAGLSGTDARYRSPILEYRPGVVMPRGLDPQLTRAWSVAVALDARWTSETWREPLAGADPYVKAAVNDGIATIGRPERMRVIVDSSDSVLVRLFVGRARYALRAYWRNDRIEDAEIWRDADLIGDQDTRALPIIGP